MVRSSLASSSVAALLALLIFPPSTAAAYRLQSDGVRIEGGHFYSFHELVNNEDTYLETVPGGRFSMKWREGSKNAVGGVGWEEGNTNRRIDYTITQFDVHKGQKQTVSIYGWMRNQSINIAGVVEYYVVEYHHNWDADKAGAQLKGRAEVGNDMYEYFNATRTNSLQAFSQAKMNFTQYWAVRSGNSAPDDQKLPLTGTVDMRAHFDNWESFGMPAKPIHGYQILAVEGVDAQGYAEGYASAA